MLYISRMKELKLIPVIDACHLPDLVEDELVGNEISTHCGFPLFGQWLIETYGEDVKNMGTFQL